MVGCSWGAGRGGGGGGGVKGAERGGLRGQLAKSSVYQSFSSTFTIHVSAEQTPVFLLLVFKPRSQVSVWPSGKALGW